jgi:hypothetical protein
VGTGYGGTTPYSPPPYPYPPRRWGDWPPVPPAPGGRPGAVPTCRRTRRRRSASAGALRVDRPIDDRSLTGQRAVRHGKNNTVIARTWARRRSTSGTGMIVVRRSRSSSRRPWVRKVGATASRDPSSSSNTRRARTHDDAGDHRRRRLVDRVRGSIEVGTSVSAPDEGRDELAETTQETGSTRSSQVEARRDSHPPTYRVVRLVPRINGTVRRA